MHIDHTYPLPESMAPKGALRDQHARFPNAHPNGHPPVKRASLRQKASWGSIFSGEGERSTYNTRQVVSAPVAWSVPMVALIVLAPPSSETVTAAPSSQNPQTIACFGAAASTMPSPWTLANPNLLGAKESERHRCASAE